MFPGTREAQADKATELTSAQTTKLSHSSHVSTQTITKFQRNCRIMAFGSLFVFLFSFFTEQKLALLVMLSRKNFSLQ
jgi:hypothetical protein